MKEPVLQTDDLGLSEMYELTQTGERIHAMDIIRGSMMLLGIVIHTACTYVTVPQSAWPFTDKQSTAAGFDFIVMFIHCFRMPLFFAVSGFFAAQLVSRRGVRSMISNRIKRIGLPFLIGLPIIYAAIVIAATFFRLTDAGSPDRFTIPFLAILSPATWAKFKTVHLWFLYYLFFISLAAALLHYVTNILRAFRAGFYNSYSSVLAASTASVLNKLFSVLIGSRWAPMLWAFFSFLCLFTTHGTEIPTDISFVINIRVFAIYSIFFLFGWQLHAQQHLLEHFRQLAFLRIGIASFILVSKFVVLALGVSDQPDITVLLMVAEVTACWLLIFGIIGIGLRYWNGYSAVGRYLSDASYWIYLVHVPIIIAVEALLLHMEISAIFKFAFTILISGFICLISYNYLVRATFIGQFLNGKKYTRGLPATNNYPAQA